jgi:hypothetical protein
MKPVYDDDMNKVFKLQEVEDFEYPIRNLPNGIKAAFVGVLYEF